MACCSACADQNHKNILGFHSNPETSQNSMLGHHRPASEMAFRWRAGDGPLLVVFGSPHQLKNVIKIGPRLNNFSGSAHAQDVLLRSGPDIKVQTTIGL